MYIVNLGQLTLSDKKIFKCNAIIGNYLVYERRIPLLGKDSDEKYCFMMTDALKKALETMPIWYKLRIMQMV